MAHIVDKYRPVDPRFAALHAPWTTLMSLWVVMAGVALWCAPELSRELAASQSRAAPVAEQLAGLARGLGITSLRSAVESAQPSMNGLGQFAKPPPPPPVVQPPPAPVGPDEDLQWTGLEAPSRRVLVVGASTINSYLGSELRKLLEETYGVVAIRDGRLGTGLVRDDVFDWPAHLRGLVATHKPDLVIANFGGNDCQPVALPSGGTAAFGTKSWKAEYSRRVTQMVRETREAGAEVIWVGTGVVKESGFNGRLRRLDEILQSAVTEAKGRYVPQADLTATDKGAYRVDVSVDGSSGLMHMPDGIHLTRLGARHVVAGLLPRLERSATLVPKDQALAVASRLEWRSALRNEDTPALVMVPQEVPAGGLPLVYLLHGAWDDWTILSEKAHRELQSMATRHGLILVMPDGQPFGWYIDGTRKPEHRLGSWFVEEQRPAAEQVLPHGGRVGLLGISMGGHGALNYALDRPGEYGAVSVLSGAVDLTFAESREALQEILGPLQDNPGDWEARSALHRLRDFEEPFPPVSLVCGTEDIWYPSQVELADVLGAGARVRWVEGRGHEWSLWLESLDAELSWMAETLNSSPGD